MIQARIQRYLPRVWSYDRKEAMYCWEATKQAFQHEDEVLTTKDAIDRVYARHPNRPWKESHRSADMVALSVNHSSSRRFPGTRKHALPFSLSNGRHRRWDLEACLLADLGQLESDLTLYEGEGRYGYQLDTGVVRRLDILAINSEGSYVVIELKAGQADEKSFGQILRYMGWVKRELRTAIR